jgi:hypothetical protein
MLGLPRRSSGGYPMRDHEEDASELSRPNDLPMSRDLGLALTETLKEPPVDPAFIAAHQKTCGCLSRK